MTFRNLVTLEAMSEAALHTRMVMAVTDYDRKQMSRRGYNPYALAQYLEAVEAIEKEISSGTTPRQAILNNLLAGLCDVTLRAIGQAARTPEEIRRYR